MCLLYVSSELCYSRARGQMHWLKNPHSYEERQGDRRHAAGFRRLCQYPCQQKVLALHFVYALLSFVDTLKDGATVTCIV